MKLPPTASLTLGSRIALGEEVETRGTLFRLVAGGSKAVVASHVAPLDAPPEPDYVAVAERFLNVPYLWGGRTSIGLDCSALVQLSLMAAGIAAPRDTDMQRDELGITRRRRHRRAAAPRRPRLLARPRRDPDRARTRSSTPAAIT